jgi:16S rRNA (adenine1518-N6/adenine1519-N6)-dimethyltransferase
MRGMDESTPSRPPHRIAQAMGKVTNKRDLAELFRDLGIRASRNLGQNFLVDHNLLDFIVRTGDVGSDDLAIDIGCGTGLLTAHLADAAGHVIGVELDRRMYGIASRYLGDRPNVELLRTDALAGKHRMHPTVMEAVARAWDSGRYASLRIVSNLPYSVASLIVPNMLECALPLACLVVMVQREVADRMVAEPGSPAYGSLSLTVQVHAKATLVRTVPPAVFWPRPRVESAIVKLVPRAGHMAELSDYQVFVETVRAAFTHRRKKLANALVSSHRLGMCEQIVQALAACDIAPGDRAEHVALAQYIQLANRLHQEQRCPP